MSDWQAFGDKIEWEGGDYVISDMGPDDVPVEVRELHSAAQTAVKNFWAAVAHESAKAGEPIDV
jgi:hypothetical protein